MLLPSLVTILAKPPTEVAVFGHRQVVIVEPGEDPLDPAQGQEQRPAARLCRMSRQDRGDPQSPEQLLELARGSPGPNAGHGAGDGIGGRPIPLRPLAAPGGPDAISLLGEVDEPEVEAERSDDDLGAVRIEPGELRHETRPERRVVASSEADRRPPDALDEVEQVPSGLLRDDLAEKRPE